MVSKELAGKENQKKKKKGLKSDGIVYYWREIGEVDKNGHD